MVKPGPIAWSVVIVTVVALAACGSGPAPETWAGQVCGVLIPWRTQIGELNTRAQQQMSTASTPAQTKASLLDLLAGGASASEKARAAVVGAGTPDVDGGKTIADRFAQSLAKTRDAYSHAHDDLGRLSTSDPSAFYGGVARVMSTLNDEYSRSGVDTHDLDSVELREAFDKVDQCQ